ncbi:MAG: nucleoside 2-deoxyribosyltransferase [Syntrophorhabdales bacterium]|nr:nucleoside 2-deoxyribosyltransferase [Syntrophorhabdales bacterium]
MKLYFAHPCFNDRQKRFKTEFLKRFSAITDRNSITIIDPFDYTPNIEEDIKVKLKTAKEVKVECIRLLEECDIIVALIDDNDTGVAFEAGYAHAINKAIILISERACSTANAMLIGAAMAMIDNILEERQMRRLVDLVLDAD